MSDCSLNLDHLDHDLRAVTTPGLWTAAFADLKEQFARSLAGDKASRDGAFARVEETLWEFSSRANTLCYAVLTTIASPQTSDRDALVVQRLICRLLELSHGDYRDRLRAIATAHMEELARIQDGVAQAEDGQ